MDSSNANPDLELVTGLHDGLIKNHVFDASELFPELKKSPLRAPDIEISHFTLGVGKEGGDVKGTIIEHVPLTRRELEALGVDSDLSPRFSFLFLNESDSDDTFLAGLLATDMGKNHDLVRSHLTKISMAVLGWSELNLKTIQSERLDKCIRSSTDKDILVLMAHGMSYGSGTDGLKFIAPSNESFNSTTVSYLLRMLPLDEKYSAVIDATCNHGAIPSIKSKIPYFGSLSLVGYKHQPSMIIEDGQVDTYP